MNKAILSIISIFGLACMQEDPEIGSDFFNDVSFEIVTWDTLTVDMFTVLIDSVQTSSPTRLLAGQAAHSELDHIKAETYFQIIPDLEYNQSELSDAEFQDAFLTFYYDRYYYGDTTELMQLEIYEVEEDIELDDELMLYNHSSFNIKHDESNQPVLLGSYTFGPRPFAQDSIEIPVNQAFAASVFEYLKSDQIIRSDFLDSLNGLMVRSLTTGAIIGFQTSPVLKLNYLDKSESPATERRIQLNSGTTEIQFNHLESAAANELFADENMNLISSELTGNQAYIQSGLGLAIRLEIPYLQDLLSADEVPIIDEVKLELVFENALPEEAYMLAGDLSVTKVDGKNDILIEYAANPELVLDIEYGEERKFILDITEFVIEQLSVSTRDNDDALLVQFTNEYANSTLNHLIISDQNKGAESSKIIINMLNIK